MALDDQVVTDTLDYLGGKQPFSGQRLTTLPSASAAGGGAVTPPLTPSGAPGTGAPTSPMGEGFANPGASPLQLALSVLGIGQKANKVSDLLNPSAPDLGSRGDTGGVSLSDAVRSVEAVGGEIPQAAGGFGGPAGFGAEAGGFGAEGGAAVGGAAGGIGEAVGEVIPFAGAAVPLIASLATGGPKNATQSANLAIETVAGALAPFTYGASEAAVGIALGVEDLLAKAPWYKTALDFLGFGVIESLFDTPGSYIPKRQEASKEAGADLSQLGSAYQSAAASADPAQILTALSTGRGGRGQVRSLLTLPPDVATSLGLPSGQVEWSKVTPEQLPTIIRYFAANPDRIDQLITGSGDVGYLPQEQAQQVAGAAAQDAQGLMRYLVGQLNAPAEAAPSGPMPPAPMAPTVPTGPEGALGFASSLVAA